MKLLKEIKDDSFPSIKYESRDREAVRIILVDEDNNTPVIYASKTDHYKIPGGGIDTGEDKLTALIRESMEEAGCKIEILGEVGKIIETRSAEKYNISKNLTQISYCYFGKILKKYNHSFTQKEINKGYQLLWINIEEAFGKFKTCSPNSHGGSLENIRDLTFLTHGYEKIKEYNK